MFLGHDCKPAFAPPCFMLPLCSNLVKCSLLLPNKRSMSDDSLIISSGGLLNPLQPLSHLTPAALWFLEPSGHPPAFYLCFSIFFLEFSSLDTCFAPPLTPLPSQWGLLGTPHIKMHPLPLTPPNPLVCFIFVWITCHGLTHPLFYVFFVSVSPFKV